ncbi:MAG: stress-induced morphogen [Rhodothermales bacterium]|jgi:stress-induced morphogen
MIDDIKSTILAALPDAEVIVEDPMNDGAHFQAIVISPSFEGLRLVNQQRAVMSALKDAFAEGVHALALKTYTPARWQQIQESQK